ncbi:membrane lipoprotein [Halorhabdus tiamatea SARL4B]|uniref:Membrane lipoprotein n=1 Tax=Halorhabdus tiamatea SARL4B TaxID=1033806 RepID=U2E265_9EURY|nr:membrane lipoprotein [Halorhabdus tiamatea SARL4B]
MAPTRRQTIGLVSAATASVVGGCSAISGHNEEAREKSLLQPGVIGYANFDNSPHTLDLVVSIQGEVEYWETLELASAEQPESEHTNGTLDLSLPSKPVEYTVLARLDGAETDQTTSTAGIQWSHQHTVENPNCTRVRVLVQTSAELDVENWEPEPEASLCSD